MVACLCVHSVFAFIISGLETAVDVVRLNPVSRCTAECPCTADGVPAVLSDPFRCHRRIHCEVCRAPSSRRTDHLLSISQLELVSALDSATNSESTSFTCPHPV